MTTIPDTHKFITLRNRAVNGVDLDVNSDKSTFQLHEAGFDAANLKEGELAVQILYLSNDPTQRIWIQAGVDPERLYVPPVQRGEVMRSLGMAKVLKANSSKFKEGDIVVGVVNWSDYTIISDRGVFNKVSNLNVPLPAYLDYLGMTGLTAYVGLVEIADIKPDQVLVVSAASGATGSMVVQVAKHVLGVKKVVGITGSDEKCQYVKSIGADECVNYRYGNFKETLKSAIGGFAEVYFDCVGGKILDAMLSLCKPFGTVVACGAISGYNDPSLRAIKNWGEIITNRLRVQGFIVGDHKEVFPEAISRISEAISSGKIKYDVKASCALYDLSNGDFDKIPETWGLLFSDHKKPGKLLTQLAKL